MNTTDRHSVFWIDRYKRGPRLVRSGQAVKVYFWKKVLTLVTGWIGLLGVGCVSVTLPTNSRVAAQSVRFENPTNPFEEIKMETADKTWISGITGNTISYLSDCQKKSDPSLEQMQTDSLSVLEEQHSSSRESLTFNQRQALLVTSDGFVDGVSVRMRILAFKKNACTYTLTYAGISKNFSKEIEYFNTFLHHFVAP